MKSSHPFVRYGACVSIAAACAAAIAMRPPPQELPDLRVAAADAAYLDCSRVSPGRVLEPDLVIVCSMVAEVRDHRLMHWQA
jgi:hypothetical protein